MRALGVRGSGCEAYRWAGLRNPENQPLHAHICPTSNADDIKTQMPTLLTNHKFGCFFSLALGVPSLPLSDCPARSYWWLKCGRKWAVVVVIWPSVQRPGYDHTLSYEQRGWEVQVESIASASVEHE